MTREVSARANDVAVRSPPKGGDVTLHDDGRDASRFDGRIDVVQIDLGDDDHRHLIDPAEVARIATSRQ